jgi:hypothetical protein
MSIYSESLGRIEGWQEDRKWYPSRGIVLVDMREQLVSPEQIADLTNTHKDVGIVLIHESGDAVWDSHNRIQNVILQGRTVESVIKAIQPEVVVAHGIDEEQCIEPVSNPAPIVAKLSDPSVAPFTRENWQDLRKPKFVDPISAGENTAGHISRALGAAETLLRGNAQFYAPLKERWLGSRRKGETYGVKKVVQETPTLEEHKTEEASKHWLRKSLAEYDVAFGVVGLLGGIIGVANGSLSPAWGSVINYGLVIAPAIETVMYATAHKIKNEKLKQTWRVGQKLIGSLFALGAGAKAGMMMGAMFGVGMDMVENVHHSDALASDGRDLFDVSEGSILPDPDHGEIVRELPTEEPLPIMDWEHLPDYFHEQLGENDWENPENGVNLSEVMADHVLENHGDMEAVQGTLDRMKETTSYTDYRLLRNVGQIY